MEASPRRSTGAGSDVVFLPATAETAQIALLDRSLHAGAGPAGSVEVSSATGVRITVPDSVVQVLALVAREMAAGNGVAVVPVHYELTTHEAAVLLHVSRPHLIRMLDEGRLPFRRVGTHRRIRFDDVMARRDREEAEREALLTRLAQESQALGLEF